MCKVLNELQKKVHADQHWSLCACICLCTKGNCAEMSVIFTAFVVVIVVVGILITYEISHKLTQNVKLAVQAQMSKGLTAQLGMGGAPKKTVV